MEHVDHSLLEIPTGSITDDDLHTLAAFAEQHRDDDDARGILQAFDMLFLAEQIRRYSEPPEIPPRYFRFTSHGWTDAEVAYALRTINTLTQSELFSEATGKIMDQLLDHCISCACLRLTQPELFR